jgi:hypothetical protein
MLQHPIMRAPHVAFPAVMRRPEIHGHPIIDCEATFRLLRVAAIACFQKFHAIYCAQSDILLHSTDCFVFPPIGCRFARSVCSEIGTYIIL